MFASKELHYKDLVQLILFPDGSPLSSRLKNAAILQEVFKESPDRHAQAVKAGNRINGQVSHWIHKRLDELHEKRPSWVPRFQQAHNTAAVQAWMSRATRHLELLLHDGLESLVGFRGELKVEARGFTPVVQQQWTWRETKTPHKLVSCGISVEDASGEPQGKVILLDATADEGANNRCILEVTSEDSVMRVQVYEHSQVGTKELLGELRVPLTSLPNIGAETELHLPVYRQQSCLPNSSVPVYKAHRDQLVSTDEQDYTLLGRLHCMVTYTTDAPQTKLRDLYVSGGSQRSGSGSAWVALVDLQRTSTAAAAQPTWPAAWSETARQERAKAAVRARWVKAVKQVIVDMGVERARINANEEILRLMNQSPVFGANNVEEVFYDLVKKVWEAWSKYVRKDTSWQPQSSCSRTRSLDSLPTMISASLGCVDYQQQPLYYVLPRYDRPLGDMMKDGALVNEYLPGMPFFHILFIYAMLRGISPWLMKICLSLRILNDLESLKTATYPLLKFVDDVISEVGVAHRQKLLSEFETHGYQQVQQRFSNTIGWILPEHTDVIPPDDAAARKLLLDVASRESPKLQQPGAIANFLRILATKRMARQLQGCDVHKIEHAFSILKDRESYEAVRKCCADLGKAWSECARDFEAYLSLKVTAKSMLAEWDVGHMITKHYEDLALAVRYLIDLTPFWPYHPELGYGAHDLQRLQDGVEDVNAVLLRLGLVKKQQPYSSNGTPQGNTGNIAAEPEAGAPGLPAAGQPVCLYEVKVFTGTLKGAGTESQILIDIRGNVKSSGRNALTEERLKKKGASRMFQSGSVDVFMLRIRGHLGALTEVELSSDGEGREHSWYVDRVEIIDKTTKQVYYFDCQAWLSKTRAGCRLEKAFTGGSDLPSATGITYLVEVMTADKDRAGTTSNIFIQLLGSAGAMQKAEYLQRKRKTDFDRNQHCQHTITCEYIGNITEIVLGLQPPQGTTQNCFTAVAHTARQQTDAWCLDHLIITNTKNNAKWLFKPNNDGWFRPNSAEYCQRLKPSEDTQYRVMVRTADEHAASLERGNVWIRLTGTEKSSGTLTLSEPVRVDGCRKNAQPFQRGQEDYFSVYWEDVGELKSLTIGHDGKSVMTKLRLAKKTNWSVSQVKVVDVTNSQQYTFEVKCTLTEKISQKTVFCRDKKGTKVKPVVTYKVWVHTSNLAGAGTDAHVTIEMFGENGCTTGRRQLVNRSKNLFEMGQVDEFTIQSDDLETLEKLEIGHDNSGFFASWHLDRVVVLDTRANRKYVFICGEWLRHRDGTSRILTPQQPETRPPTPGIGPTSSTHSSSSSAPQQAHGLQLLDWTELMQLRVDRQIDHTNNIKYRIVPIPTNGASTSQEWAPVSQRHLHSQEKVDLTRGIVELIELMARDVVVSITHSHLRAHVAQRVLLKVIQPAATRVMKHLQQACFQELSKVRLPGCPDSNKPTIFQLTIEEMQSLCYRINTLLYHSSHVHEKLEEFGREVSAGRMKPVHRRLAQQETERVLRDSRSKAGSVQAELRKAMRYSFAVMLQELSNINQHDDWALIESLAEFVTDSIKRIATCWLSDPAAMKQQLYDLCWSSLLEAIQCQLLGLSIWSLDMQNKLTVDQVSTIEAGVKIAESNLTDQESFRWRPQQSLAEADSLSYLRQLLEAARAESEELYVQMLEQSRDMLLQSSMFDGQPDMPYFGTEVVATYHDLQSLQQPVRTKLCILDLVRLLRSRERQAGMRDYAAAVEQQLRDLHNRQQMNVLFGIPSHEVQSASYAIHLTHKHPESRNHDRAAVQVAGQLYVYTSYVAFTTLIKSGSSAIRPQMISCVPEDVLTFSDYTAVWTAAEDILHTDLLTASSKLLITLADYSAVELSLQAATESEALLDCYRKICLTKGVEPDAGWDGLSARQEGAAKLVGRR